MARYMRLEVLNAMLEDGLVPLFYDGQIETALAIMRACAEGGARCVEFTNRGDKATLVFQELVRQAESMPQVILGVGSVIEPGTASLYIQLGANFIVGPVFNQEVARLCNRRKVAYIPGCGTVSEISAAEELGVEICKVFPAGQIGGPDFIKSVRGPMPWTRLMPTGGVEAAEDNISAWIKAGAACLGIGSNLVRKEDMAAKNFEAIRERTSKVLGWIKSARSN
jgi:2-dehydro-3-deoxyphosphogluconate aldolase/(4S)-4-hydroxy-2-oxoglutarate aldolase